jgi:hypothetical protein
MSAMVCFRVHGDRGKEILEELERQTDLQSVETPMGEREFFLSSSTAGVDGFDAMLDRIASDWRDHLSR